MLSLLMVLPIFIFLFLHAFGENHYRVPIFYPEEVTESNKDGKMVYDTTYHVLPVFHFIDQSGDSVTTASLNGKILISDFIFTRCQGPCPIMTNQLVRVQEAFKNSDVIQILSHTVDPEYDTIAVLKQFATRFKADPKIWHFVTGKSQDLYNLSGPGGYKLALQTGNGDPETIDHSSKLVLVDKERRIRGYYNGTDEKEVDRLILETKILLHEYGIN